MDAIQVTSLINQDNLGFEPKVNFDFEQIYDHMRKLAKFQKIKINNNQINTTMLVNEAWLKLKKNDKTYQNRNHFFAVCSMAMRHILINESKRLQRVFNEQTITEQASEMQQLQNETSWLLELEHHLASLKRYSQRLEQVFIYRFFGGMANQEIAEILNVTVRTIDRDWQTARLLISKAMQ